MSNFTEPRAIETSLKVYRRLLAAYPREHLAEYGAPMEQLFRDQCRDAWNEERIWGLVKHWLRVIPDLLRTSILEHLTRFNRRNAMSKLFNARSTPLSIFITAFSAVFLLVFGASVIITFMLPAAYSSTARIRMERGAVGYVTNAQGQVESVIDPYAVQRSFSSNPGKSDRFVQGAYDPYFIQTEFEVLQSEVILGPVVDMLELQDLWGQKYGGGQRFSRRDAIDKLKHDIYLSPVRNTAIIEIRVYAQAPSEAAKIANAIAESFKDYRRKQLRQTASVSLPDKRIEPVQIIDPAVLNPRPIAPKKVLNIVLGIVLGIFLGSLAGAAACAGSVFIRRRRQGHPNSPNPSHATS